MSRSQLLASIQIAFTYVGTVIGAGFATGQELLQFFAAYGFYGLIGLAIAGYGFFRLGPYIIELGHRLQATGYHPILYHVCGPKLGAILDACTAVFLFSGMSIMLAAAATIGRDFFNLPYAAGLAVMAVALLITMMGGIRSIASVNMLLMPVLICCSVGISFYSLVHHGAEAVPLLFTEAEPLSWRFILSGLLYLSYNMVLGASILAPLGKAAPEKTVRQRGGQWGGLILTLLAFWLTAVILIHYPQVVTSEVPMLSIAQSQHWASYLLYAAVLLMAVYTTAIASLYGAADKLAGVGRWPLNRCVLIVTAAGLAFSGLGFTALIRIIYPFFGLLSLYFTFKLMWLSYRDS